MKATQRFSGFLGVLVLLVWPALASAQRLTEEYGYDRVGSDYNSFQTNNLDACKSACGKDSRCRAYTYLPSKQECYLKDRVNSAQRSRDGVTGVKQEFGGGGGIGNLTEEPGYDRRGDDYTSFRGRDLNECQRACNRESRCRAYTFDTRSGDCYLKSRVNKGQRDGGMVTGYKTDGGAGETRPPYPGGGGGSLTEESGRDRKGNDYDSFRSRSLDDCKQECRRDSRCQAYTFIRSSRECYLKNRINSARDNYDAVTGYKSDSDYGSGGGLARLTEEYGVDRKGNDYDSFRVRNLTECKQECRDASRCQAYTYIQTTRECFLKDRVNSAQGNRDAVTGYKERD
ncbi:MAG TPA: PAN/Apple domain-containing protein [Thermoanaerobaculia bacterium]|jgi:hypothetical protein|nr:PAN/Apple domain-containing protein [Thermoanaerobaculia bacterium]